MTIPEEIEQLKIQLERAKDNDQQAEVLLVLLRKCDSINSINSAPYIDHLLLLAAELKSTHYRAQGLYHLAFLHCLKHEDTAALNITEQILLLFGELKDKKGVADTYHIIGTIHEHRCHYPSALEFHSKALQIREEIGDKEGIAASHNNKGVINELQGDYHQALRNHLQALQIREEIGDKSGIAASYNNIGFIHHTKGNYPEALKNYLRALRIMEEINYALGSASLYNNIGLVHQYQGNYPGALKNYLRALHIREELNDPMGIAILYNNIGLLHQYMDDYSQALDCFLKALNIWQSIGDKLGTAHSYINIGIAQQHLNNYSDAFKNFTDALQICNEIGDKHGAAEAYNNRGVVMEYQGRYPEALQDHLHAFRIKEEIGDREGMASCYNSIGTAYEKQGNNTEAIVNRLLALQLSEEIGHKDLIKQSALLLFNTYKDNGNFINALKYHEIYHRVESELLGEASQKQLNSLNFQHNIEQKEKVAEIERLKNVELKQALDKLQLEKNRSEQLFQNQIQDLKSNALQAQMNPHFVFNSLNAIQQYIWEKDPEEATAYLNRFAKLIRSVLDNSRRQFVTLEQDLTALGYYIELESLRFEKKFEYQITCDARLNKKEIQLPPMLIQPFVENAIIHGLQPLDTNGKLSITVGQLDKYLLHITIEDNGVGRKKAEQLKVGKGPSHQSVALQLTKERLEKMDTGIRNENAIVISDLYDSKHNSAGTKVEINVPVEFVL